MQYTGGLTRPTRSDQQGLFCSASGRNVCVVYKTSPAAVAPTSRCQDGGLLLLVLPMMMLLLLLLLRQRRSSCAFRRAIGAATVNGDIS
jgi:hypothetical protein